MLILGAGQAGLQLAAALRERGWTDPITLVGDEAHAPYMRPPLSKAFLKGDAAPADLLFRPPDWYAGAGVTLLTGRAAVAAELPARRVRLSDGEILPFDILVFATGARARTLPDLPPTARNVIHLRGIEDALRARALLRGARRALAIGGGFIGLEFAAMAAGRGIPVTVAEAGPRVMGRAVSPAISAWFAELHRRNGVDLRCGVHALRIERAGPAPADPVRAVHLSDGGRISPDLVAVGVGAVANDDLAAAAGLACRDGVLVDDRLRARGAAAPVYAIGDVARMDGPGGGLRLESVQNAVDQARHLAALLTGEDAPYRAPPWFWSEQFDARLQIAGLPPQSPEEGRERGPEEGPAQRPGQDPAKAPKRAATGPAETGAKAGADAPQTAPFALEHRRGGALVCVESVNDPRAHMRARRALREEAAAAAP